jgi:hypothetical protein
MKTADLIEQRGADFVRAMQLEAGFTEKEGKAHHKPGGFNAQWCRKLASIVRAQTGVTELTNGARGTKKLKLAAEVEVLGNKTNIA